MNKPKTVLYIHHSDAMGGAPRSLAYLIRELDKDCWNPVVLTPADGDVAQMFRDAGAKVYCDPRVCPFPGSTSPVNSPFRLLRAWILGRQTCAAVADYVQRLAPDVVHLNSTSLFMAARGARNIAPKVRIICHARETLAGGFGTKIIRFMNNRYCDAFIALDVDGLERLKVKGREAIVVPNFVDTYCLKNFRCTSNLKKEYNLNNNDIIVLFLARIYSINGVLESVKLIQKLPEEFLHTHFFFFGYAEEKEFVKENYSSFSFVDFFKGKIKGIYRKLKPSYLERVQSSADMSSNIHILPFSDNVLSLLGSADILLCPFTKPHFSRSIIEAAAMCIPSLTTNIPSLRTLVDHKNTGMLFDINCQTSFEKSLRVLVFDKEKRGQMGEAARKKADTLFNGKKNSKKTFSLY